MRNVEANLPANPSQIEKLLIAIRTELNKYLFLFVNADRAAFFEKEYCLSTNAKIAFPKATQQLQYAGNSYAAGLDTAVIFYCMRALEHGLKSLADNVDIKFDSQTWHGVLDQIESAIKESRKAPKGAEKMIACIFSRKLPVNFAISKTGGEIMLAITRSSTIKTKRST